MTIVARITLGLAVLAVACLLTLAALQRRFIYPSPKSPPPPLVAGFEAVDLATPDGLRLIAWYRPAASGRATIIFWHGNGDSLHGSVVATAALAARGYGLLLPEYPGYGGNPGSPDEAGLYAEARAAATFLRSRGVADAATFAMGNSLGSGPATQLATERALAGLIIVSGFRSLPLVVVEKFGLPVGFLVRDRYDNAAKIAALQLPVLVLHGDADRVIPVSHGRALGQERPTVSYREFAGRGHELAYLPEAQLATLEWLDRQATAAAAKARP